MPDFVPGQRWINSAESQLSLGTVLTSEQRTVTLVFMATGDTRTYAKLTVSGLDPRSNISNSVKDLLVARTSHQNDNPSLDLCSHKEFSSLGKTVRIPLGQKMPCENKSLRDHLALWREMRASPKIR